jgi:hypothetical protein
MRAFLLGAACIALWIPACSDPHPGPDVADPDDQQGQGEEETDTMDPPTPEESARDQDELAQILGAHIRGEFAIQLMAAEISESRMPEGFAMTAPGQGTGVAGSMTYAFTFWCNDGSAAHTVVPCDGTAHHSHVQLTMTGSQTVDSVALDQINRYVDWEIRDITLDKARFRGPDNLAMSTAVTTEGVQATYKLNIDATYEQVRYMPDAQFPTYGTIDFGINAERIRGTDRRVFTPRARLVYGSSGVPTTLTFNSTEQYKVNLTTGEVSRL